MAFFFQQSERFDPRRRMFSLAVALVLVLLLVVRMFYASQPAPTQPPPPQPLRFADGDPRASLPSTTGAKTVSQATRDLLARDDANLLESGDLAALAPAIEEITDCLMASRQPSNVWPRSRWHWEKLMRYPDRWRLEHVHVYGRLMMVQEQAFPGIRAGLGTMFRLTLLDEELRQYYTVLTPALSEEAVPFTPKQHAGSFVACDAVFLKRFPYQTDNGWMRAPLFLALEAVRATEGPTPPLRLDERGDPGKVYAEIRPAHTLPALDLSFLQEQILAPNKDGTLPDGSKVKSFGVDIREMAANLAEEKPALDHVFDYVWGLSTEALGQMAHNPEINYPALMDGNGAPLWMRGQAARVRAVAGNVNTLHFADNPSGITRVHLVTVGDLAYANFREYTWMLAVLNLPPELRAGDELEVDGIFYKLVPYRTETGWHWSPLLVCRELRPVARSSSPFFPDGLSRTETWALYAGAALAIFAFFGWLRYSASRENSDMQRLVGRHRRKNLNVSPRLKPHQHPGEDAARPTDTNGEPS